MGVRWFTVYLCLYTSIFQLGEGVLEWNAGVGGDKCEFDCGMGRIKVVFERCEVGVSMWPYEGDVIDETCP